MLFSILIPVYQVKKYLRQCVDSVLSQSEQDFEIILVDDGSTDGSGAICDEYAARFPDTIRVIHQENRGLLLARRTAIRAAKGEWFVHLDSDDYMMPGALSAIRETVDQSDADLVLCKVAYGNAGGVEITRESDLPFRDCEVFEDKKKLLMQFLYVGQITAIYQKIAKREIVDIDTDYQQWKHVNIMEDHLQTLPLFDRCQRPVFLNKAVVYYRVNDGGMTKQRSFDALTYAFRSVQSVYKEEERYREKWNLGSNAERMICAKHMKKMCILLQQVMRASAEKSKRTQFLLHISEDELLKKEFHRADKSIMGPKAFLCFFFLFHHLFHLLHFELLLGW